MARKINPKKEMQRKIRIEYPFDHFIIRNGGEELTKIREKFKKVQITFLSFDIVYTLKGPKSDVDKCCTFLEDEVRKMVDDSEEEESSDSSSEEDETDEEIEGESSKKYVRNAGKKKADVKFTQSTEQSSSQVWPAILLLVGVAVLIFAVFVALFDRSYFFDLVKAAINVSCLYWSYIYDFVTASTNVDFCNPHKNDTCDKILLQKFKDLGNKYNDQSMNTWLTLYSAARDHVSYKPNPQRPVVIMVYRLGNISRVNEILQDIAGVYESVLPPYSNYGNILIDGKSFNNSDPEKTQKKVQEILENGFEKAAKKVAIVHDFDKLPSCSVLTFHNYCNNDDAPHKNVAIILMVTAGDEQLSSDPSAPELEKAVSKLLHEKWKDCPKELPPGKIDAMLSRVANNVILLR